VRDVGDPWRNGVPEPWSDEDFRPIALALRARQGAAMTPQRLRVIHARLQARLRARGIPSFSWFHQHHLHARPEGRGMQMLVDLSTINHSVFFRESGPLGFVADRLAERLRATAGLPVRVWSAGCAAGQEPYSLVMAVAERVPPELLGRLEVWASDLSLEMVRAAASATYEARELAEVGPERLRRFFLRGRGPRVGTYRLAPEVRRLVAFEHFDLRAAAWPVPEALDAILCRNVAIYFEEAERIPLVERLGARLREGGWLVLGQSEILPGLPRGLCKQGPALFRKEAAR
jgi:chemotaxis protein methyltransferase CheR